MISERGLLVGYTRVSLLLLLAAVAAVADEPTVVADEPAVVVAAFVDAAV